MDNLVRFSCGDRVRIQFIPTLHLASWMSQKRTIKHNMNVTSIAREEKLEIKAYTNTNLSEQSGSFGQFSSYS